MKNASKKIVACLALFTLIFTVVSFATPQKADAQEAVTDIVTEVESTLSTIANHVTAIATLGSNIQTTVLDKVATAIAKALLQQITESVINWINSGFQGNPAFVQNPTAFFENIGDQLTGQFISSTGALASLCSPFSLQVRLAIVAQQQAYDGIGNQYSCTLSTIIQNTTNAVQNASINGFVSGDFSQGGWEAFAALTMEPQNNPNGAYLMAEDNLQQKIAAQTTQKQNELNQGGGFLSWESCTPNTTTVNVDSEGPASDGGSAGPDISPVTTPSLNQNPIESSNPSTPSNDVSSNDLTADVGDAVLDDQLDSATANSVGGVSVSPIYDNTGNSVSGVSAPATNASTNSSNANADDPILEGELESATTNSVGGVSVPPIYDATANDPYNSAAEVNPNETCTVQTPGSVISAALNKHLAVPSEELELANSINDIINAAFSEIVVIALQKGLSSLSSNSSGAGGAYLQNAVNSADEQSFSSTQSSMLNTITPYVANAQTVAQTYGSALSLIATTTSEITGAEACYQNLLANPTVSAYPLAVNYLQGQLSSLQNINTSSFANLAASITTAGEAASSSAVEYQQMYSETENAQSLADLTVPEETLNEISGTEPTATDIQTAENNVAPVQSTVAPIQQQANTALEECQAFNLSNYETSASTQY